MPRGFLIKRSKKVGPVSYRMREADTTDMPLQIETNRIYTPHLMSSVNFSIRVPSRVVFGGMPESICALSLSPTRPDSDDYDQYPPVNPEHQMSSSLSPNTAQDFPEANMGNFLANGSPAMPSLPEMTTNTMDTMCVETKSAMKRHAFSKVKSPNTKKRKSTNASVHDKKSNVRDEVTTSPVLGLRITKDVENESKHLPNIIPLGEFICQLCKEGYADPLALAHHKCSRIVRVEYRCDECDKVFSCPANLASHRRWHKPKATLGERDDSRPSTPTNKDASPASPQPSESSSDEEMFNCPQCSKKFRRQAYLRKHIALHNRKAGVNPQNKALSHGLVDVRCSSPAEVKSLQMESPEALAKHQENEKTEKVIGEVFPCRFCSDNFNSSPGLTRHINKNHPTESRQVIVLSQTI